jgi:hypothetical protein
MNNGDVYRYLHTGDLYVRIADSDTKAFRLVCLKRFRTVVLDEDFISEAKFIYLGKFHELFIRRNEMGGN